MDLAAVPSPKLWRLPYGHPRKPSRSTTELELPKTPKMRTSSAACRRKPILVTLYRNKNTHLVLISRGHDLLDVWFTDAHPVLETLRVEDVCECQAQALCRNKDSNLVGEAVTLKGNGAETLAFPA